MKKMANATLKRKPMEMMKKMAKTKTNNTTTIKQMRKRPAVTKTKA